MAHYNMLCRGFINIRGALIFVVGLNHEIKCQRTSNSKSLFITEIKKTTKLNHHETV